MCIFCKSFLTTAVVFLLAPCLHAQPTTVTVQAGAAGKGDFAALPKNWTSVDTVPFAISKRPEKAGVLLNTPTKTHHGNLFSASEYGDLDLELDFMMAKGSNSGVYLQGRYEVQLFDSFGVKNPQFSDCGGIYQRWDEAKKLGSGGHPPAENACLAPGEWQHLRIEFRAPRFDAAGAKTANARFVKVSLNGRTLHQNVEVIGPTRAAAFPDETLRGPLMIQGDHGPVAIRNLHLTSHDDYGSPRTVLPRTSRIPISPAFNYEAPANLLTVIRITP